MQLSSWAWLIGDGILLILALAELWSLRRERRRDRERAEQDHGHSEDATR